MEFTEFLRPVIIAEAYGPEPVKEFFPLDFRARFPDHIWKDFFISHDFVYADRFWVPFSNDVDGICCVYECRQCNVRIQEIIEGNQPAPDEVGSPFDPDDYYVPSQYGGCHLQGAPDLTPYKRNGVLHGEDIPSLTPKDIWPCPNPNPNRVTRSVESVGNSFDPNAWIDFWLENDE